MLAGFTENDEQPIIDRREAKTTVRIQNGETFVLGGLRQRTKIQTRSGIPYLKDRKYIGKLFRFKQDTFRESELLVFITPQIVPSTARRTPREDVASQFSQEELDCNRRAPDVCWPCSNDDALKSGGPRHLMLNSPRAERSATPGNQIELPPAASPGEATAETFRPDSSPTYDEPIDGFATDSPSRVDRPNPFSVQPLVTGQATANSTQVRQTKLPLTTRLKNALRVSQQRADQPAAGEFAPSEIGTPAGGAGTSDLDLNKLFDILPMSGRSNPQQKPTTQTRKTTTRKSPIRLLRFLKSPADHKRITSGKQQTPPVLDSKYSDRLFTGKVSVDQPDDEGPVFADDDVDPAAK